MTGRSAVAAVVAGLGVELLMAACSRSGDLGGLVLLTGLSALIASAMARWG